MINKILLILIIFLALILRVWKITEYPAGLNADEAAVGYNAYSLLMTGKDEFGHPWPIAFQSFNDFKPGAYFYLVLPFIKFLGLSELAVRLPSVLLGVGTVFLVFLLVKKLFKNQTVGLVSSLLLAISPWHLHFSRGSWESNAAVFFITFGIYLFFVSLKRSACFAFCILSFTFSMYTYHSARVIVPLLIMGLLVFYGKRIFVKNNLKGLVISAILGVFLITPLVLSFFGRQGTSRFAGVGIFADQGPFWRANEARAQHQNPYLPVLRIIHNRYFEYFIRFAENYFSHFEGNFLFISGDEIQRNRVPEMGQMYLLEAPFLVLGLYFLLKNKPDNWQFLLWWLAVAPVASAMTFQSPHAIRALNMVIPLVIVASYGLYNSYSKLHFTFYILVFTFYIWSAAFYLHQYYVHYPKTYPAAWEYGFRQTVNFVAEKESNYDKILVTKKYDQPYILFAFYLRYPPESFQKEAKLSPKDEYGFSTVEHFGKYYFGAINWEKAVREEGKVLIIGAPEEIPDSGKIIKRIYFKDDQTEVFRIAEN